MFYKCSMFQTPVPKSSTDQLDEAIDKLKRELASAEDEFEFESGPGSKQGPEAFNFKMLWGNIINAKYMLPKLAEVLSPGTFADLAKYSIAHVELVLSVPEIADKIIAKGFHVGIGEYRPEAAAYILNHFNDRLNGEDKQALKAYASESDLIQTLAESSSVRAAHG